MESDDDLQQQTCALLRTSPLHWQCLLAARELALPDWYLGAGFVRNLIWDHLHGYRHPTALSDIDLIYLDQRDPDGRRESEIEACARALLPGQNWEARNQARMHLRQRTPPFDTALTALSHWVELPTCIGVRLLADDRLLLVAPHGIAHNWSLEVRPNPHCRQGPALFTERVRAKRWQQLWPRLRVHWPA
ncbi:nucleotidyltransferase family protein [Aeromonas simiae]|uniref:nucleotidyltransferase family protein n=1 Tax=Aeromonas simiae TaxID=218936 RepID=UPI00266D9111|nr:nucleotidyltransferase family protein [Aeromonas simiae]MDO2947081.1 nucleotidyltransferase family protein [Aeromonas simiae]MDO2950693.1 nucleotidyltransferase family protein [Aeromonas simiae]MDO2954325.1 nucleotidyltransferase family protein [Aeromonas simiae]